MVRLEKHAMGVMPINTDLGTQETVPSEKHVALLLGVESSSIERIAPLTPMQRDLYLDYLVSSDPVSFSFGTIAKFGSDFDEDLWRRAVALVVEHEPILRTVFLNYQDTILQVALKDIETHFACINLEDAGYHESESLEDFILHNFIKVRYELLSSEPAVRNYLLKDVKKQCIAVFACHHIVSDALSLRMFLERAGSVYGLLLNGQSPDMQNYGSFYDSVTHIRHLFDTPEIQDYWRHQFQSVVPLQSYHRDTAFPRIVSKKIVLEGLELQQLRELCASKNYSLPAYFRFLYCILLNTYYHAEDDFVIYSLINGRSAEQKEALGCFIHVLPIIIEKAPIDNNAPFAEILASLRRYRKKVGEKQNISTLQQKQLLKNEAVRFYYNFLDFGSINFLGNTIELDLPVYDYYGRNEFHFVVDDKKDKIELFMYYDQSTFSDIYFLDRICSLSRQAVSGACTPRELNILLEQEKHQFLRLSRALPQAPFHDKSFAQLFKAQARLMPDALAVSYEDEQVSYAQLHERSNHLAWFLQEQGIGVETLVSILADRSIDFLVAILAIFKVGAAYLPFNPYYPAKQLSQVMIDSASPFVLVSRSFLPTLTRAFENVLTEQQPHIAILEDVLHQQMYNKRDIPPVNSSLHNLSYVIYTSGSTGIPKGAMVEQRGMLNHLYAKIRELNLTRKDTIVQNASQSFDISVWQWLVCLLVGGRVQIVSDHDAHDPVLLMQNVERYQVTVLEIVPSLLQGLFMHLQTQGPSVPILSSLRWLISTGEALSPKLARMWLQAYPHVSLLNAYGPTECSDDVTHYLFDESLTDAVMHTPIGYAIDNINLYVLDQHMQMAPLGVSGELYVGGVGVGRGYVHDPIKTAGTFVPDAFGSEPGMRMYKTGDIVRYLPNGNLEYLERIDQQVKIRGFRVELGEIEATIQAFPGVSEVAVTVYERVPGDKRLVAYVVSQPNVKLTSDELRSWVHKNLPAYAVPANFILLEQFPLTPNGKIDRQALPIPDFTRLELSQAHVCASNPTQEVLTHLWSDVLGIKDIGIHDNFFELGGNSLLAIQLVAKIREACQVDVSLRALLGLSTIASLAQYIDEA